MRAKGCLFLLLPTCVCARARSDEAFGNVGGKFNSQRSLEREGGKGEPAPPAAVRPYEHKYVHTRECGYGVSKNWFIARGGSTTTVIARRSVTSKTCARRVRRHVHLREERKIDMPRDRCSPSIPLDKGRSPLQTQKDRALERKGFFLIDGSSLPLLAFAAISPKKKGELSSGFRKRRRRRLRRWRNNNNNKQQHRISFLYIGVVGYRGDSLCPLTSLGSFSWPEAFSASD